MSPADVDPGNVSASKPASQRRGQTISSVSERNPRPGGARRQTMTVKLRAALFPEVAAPSSRSLAFFARGLMKQAGACKQNPAASAL